MYRTSAFTLLHKQWIKESDKDEVDTFNLKIRRFVCTENSGWIELEMMQAHTQQKKCTKNIYIY